MPRFDPLSTAMFTSPVRANASTSTSYAKATRSGASPLPPHPPSFPPFHAPLSQDLSAAVPVRHALRASVLSGAPPALLLVFAACAALLARRYAAAPPLPPPPPPGGSPPPPPAAPRPAAAGLATSAVATAQGDEVVRTAQRQCRAPAAAAAYGMARALACLRCGIEAAALAPGGAPVVVEVRTSLEQWNGSGVWGHRKARAGASKACSPSLLSLSKLQK